MDKQELLDLSNSLDSIHKCMCGIFAKHPGCKEIQKATSDIAYVKEYLDKKIEAIN